LLLPPVDSNRVSRVAAVQEIAFDLKTEFVFIIIDSPPGLPVADAVNELNR